MKVANIFFKIAKGIVDKEPTKEHTLARCALLGKIQARATKGHMDLMVYNKDLEGKNYNLRGYLTAEGFTLINRPNKMVYILWNC